MNHLKYAFFDLDDTLTHEGFGMCPPLCDDTLQVLQACRALGLQVAIVSHNSDAQHICENVGISQYIHAYFAWGAADKREHLTAALGHFHASPEECAFFDDIAANDRDAQRMGFQAAVLVPWKTGITMQLFLGA